MPHLPLLTGKVAGRDLVRASLGIAGRLSAPVRKEAAWVVFGQVGTFFGSLVGLKILTQVLPPEVYGHVNLLMLGMTLVGWLSFEPFKQSMIRTYWSSSEEGKLGNLARSAVTVYAVISAAVALVWLGWSSDGWWGVRRWIGAVPALVLGVFLVQSWQALGHGICYAARLRARVSAASIVNAWLVPICAAGLVIKFGVSVGNVLLGYLFAGLVALVIVAGPLLHEVNREGAQWWDGKIVKQMLTYGVPFVLWSPFSWSIAYLDRYVLQALAGPSEVGVYAAAYQVAQFPFTFGTALLSQFITPIAFQRAGESNDPIRLRSAESLVRVAALFFAAVGTVIVLAYALAGPAVMLSLTRGDYVASRAVLVTLAASALFAGLSQLAAVAILVHNRTWLFFWACLLPGVLNVPASWILVSGFGMLGAAAANVFVSAVFLATTCAVLRVAARRTAIE